MDPITVELSDDASRIIIHSNFRDKDLVKKVPGTRFDPQAKVWWTPTSWPTCHALRGVFGDRLVIGERLRVWASAMAAWSDSVREFRLAEDCDGDPREYSFQRVGTAWLQAVKFGLLADEMGTGKTVQACCALNDIAALEERPILIVSPNSVKRVWLDHLRTWCPQLRAEVIGGGAAARRKTFAKLDAGELDVVIINWESLRLHSRLAGFGDIQLTDKEKEPKELNRPWLCVIADEAHRAKSPRAKQTRALWAASASSEYRWAFTGTPIANAPDDLWSLLHFIHPTNWPSKSRWVDRYAMLSWNAFGGLEIVGLAPENEAELRKTLDVHMLRRAKAEVLPDLPPVVNETRWVELTPKERKAYDDMAKKLVAELDDGNEIVGWNPLTKRTRLLQFASATIVVDEAGEYRLSEPSSKLDECMATIEDIGTKPVVVAAKSRQLIELLEARLEKAKISYGSVHGNIGEEARARAIEEFQAGRLRCMLLTTGAGGEGITLTAADTMIMLQRPDSMVEDKQVIGRVDRLGQAAERVTIIDLVTVDTMEEAVFENLDAKAGRLEEVVRDKARLRELFLTGVKPKKAPAKEKATA